MKYTTQQYRHFLFIGKITLLQHHYYFLSTALSNPTDPKIDVQYKPLVDPDNNPTKIIFNLYEASPILIDTLFENN